MASRLRITVCAVLLLFNLGLILHYEQRIREVTAVSRWPTYRRLAELAAGRSIDATPGKHDCDQQSTWRQLRDPAKVLEVVTCGTLIERVRQFNVALDKMREKVVRDRGGRDWNGTTNGTTQVVWGADDDFLVQLESEDPRSAVDWC